MVRYGHQFGCKEWTILCFVVVVVGALFAPSAASMQDIQTSSIVSAPRVAPGESMPVRVRLSNFGSIARSDATITYAVVDTEGREILTSTETVAVDTTAAFIYTFLLTKSILPGQYVMKVSIVYQGQEAPAVSSYQFTVERKVAGVFVNDLLRYGLISLVLMFFVLGAIWMFEKYHHRSQNIEEYSNIPKNVLIYYEIVSDVIKQMRMHQGDEAIAMAGTVPGLTVDNNTGRVSRIEGDPAVVVAALVSRYEKSFGKKVNFSLGKKFTSKTIVKSK